MPRERVLIVIWVTGRCNLRCKYCYASAVKEKYDMDFEIAVRVLDYFADYSMKIQFAGGEPLLNFNLIRRIYEYVLLRGYNAVFQMQTNATLIDRERAKAIKKMQIALGVSMDGPPGINEYLRGGTRLTVDGIQTLAKEGVTININSVITDRNINALSGLADFALFMGNIAGIGFDLLRNSGRAKEGLITGPSATQLKSTLYSLYKRCNYLFQLTGKRIIIREIEEAARRLQYVCGKDYCYASCGKSFVILPGGDVYPCGSLISDPGYFMGNIRSSFLKRISLPEKKAGNCLACEYNDFCPGGCPSRMIINKNTPQEVTPDCVLKKTAFEIVSFPSPPITTAALPPYKPRLP